MATVYSSRTSLPKFICSILAIGLFAAGVLLTGAYPHPDFNNHDQTNSSTEAGNHTTTENNTIAAARLEFIQASNEALHAHLEEVLAKIEQNMQQNTDLSDKIAEE